MSQVRNTRAGPSSVKRTTSVTTIGIRIPQTAERAKGLHDPIWLRARVDGLAIVG